MDASAQKQPTGLSRGALAAFTLACVVPVMVGLTAVLLTVFSNKAVSDAVWVLRLFFYAVLGVAPLAGAILGIITVINMKDRGVGSWQLGDSGGPGRAGVVVEPRARGRGLAIASIPIGFAFLVLVAPALEVGLNSLVLSK